MKKVLAVVALAAVLLLASFYVTGQRVEPVLQGLLNQAAAQNSGLTVTPVSKSGGLFTSRLVYNLKLALAPDRRNPTKPNTLSVDVTYDVAHGPVPFTAGVYTPCMADITSTFAVREDSNPDIVNFFKMLPDLEKIKTRTLLAFDSSMTTDLDAPAFTRTVTNPQGVATTFIWKGASGRMHAPAEFTSITGSLTAPGLTIQDKDAVVALQDLKCDLKGKFLLKNVWSGGYTLRLASLDVKPEGKDALSLKDLTGDVSLTPRGEVLDYVVAFAAIFMGSQGTPTPAKVALSFKSLDMAALNDLITLTRATPKAPGVPAVSETELRNIGNAMLARSPSIELDAEAVEGGDKLTLRAEFHTEGMKTLPFHMLQALPMLRASADFSGREQALLQLACSISSRVEKGLKDKNQCMTDLAARFEQFVSKGFAMREGDTLVSRARWDGQEFTVNGKPLK